MILRNPSGSWTLKIRGFLQKLAYGSLIYILTKIKSYICEIINYLFSTRAFKLIGEIINALGFQYARQAPLLAYNGMVSHLVFNNQLLLESNVSGFLLEFNSTMNGTVQLLIPANRLCVNVINQTLTIATPDNLLANQAFAMVSNVSGTITTSLADHSLLTGLIGITRNATCSMFESTSVRILSDVNVMDSSGSSLFNLAYNASVVTINGMLNVVQDVGGQSILSIFNQGAGNLLICPEYPISQGISKLISPPSTLDISSTVMQTIPNIMKHLIVSNVQTNINLTIVSGISGMSMSYITPTLSSFASQISVSAIAPVANTIVNATSPAITIAAAFGNSSNLVCPEITNATLSSSFSTFSASAMSTIPSSTFLSSVITNATGVLEPCIAPTSDVAMSLVGNNINISGSVCPMIVNSSNITLKEALISVLSNLNYSIIGTATASIIIYTLYRNRNSISAKLSLAKTQFGMKMKNVIVNIKQGVKNYRSGVYLSGHELRDNMLKIFTTILDDGKNNSYGDIALINPDRKMMSYTEICNKCIKSRNVIFTQNVESFRDCYMYFHFTERTTNNPLGIRMNNLKDIKDIVQQLVRKNAIDNNENENLLNVMILFSTFVSQYLLEGYTHSKIISIRADGNILISRNVMIGVINGIFKSFFDRLDVITKYSDETIQKLLYFSYGMINKLAIYVSQFSATISLHRNFIYLQNTALKFLDKVQTIINYNKSEKYKDAYIKQKALYDYVMLISQTASVARDDRNKLINVFNSNDDLYDNFEQLFRKVCNGDTDLKKKFNDIKNNAQAFGVYSDLVTNQINSKYKVEGFLNNISNWFWNKAPDVRGKILYAGGDIEYSAISSTIIFIISLVIILIMVLIYLLTREPEQKKCSNSDDYAELNERYLIGI